MKRNGVLNQVQIIELLCRYRVDFSDWDGVSGRKSLGDLVNSIKLGEMRLETEDDILVLHINVSVVTVRYTQTSDSSKPISLELYEDRQEWNDGTVKRRSFTGSLGEKIRCNKSETPLMAAKRGLFEELGFPIKSKYQLTRGKVQTTDRRLSDWYPGLYDIYHRHHFTCTISDELYKPEYVEIYLDKRIYFTWYPIHAKID